MICVTLHSIRLPSILATLLRHKISQDLNLPASFPMCHDACFSLPPPCSRMASHWAHWYFPPPARGLPGDFRLTSPVFSSVQFVSSLIFCSTDARARFFPKSSLSATYRSEADERNPCRLAILQCTPRPFDPFLICLRLLSLVAFCHVAFQLERD